MCTLLMLPREMLLLRGMCTVSILLCAYVFDALTEVCIRYRSSCERYCCKGMCTVSILLREVLLLRRYVYGIDASK